jgi:secondary thiamine-phosphate synthase enzyme
METKKLTDSRSGVLYLFLPHTSCGLIIQESFDPSAKADMEKFLKHLAPRTLSFIEHTAEGPDDSPSHMKTILTGNSLQVIVENGEILLGTWQGIYLCEFRDGRHSRKVHLKFIEG